jgi:hypothetical protein
LRTVSALLEYCHHRIQHQPASHVFIISSSLSLFSLENSLVQSYWCLNYYKDTLWTLWKVLHLHTEEGHSLSPHGVCILVGESYYWTIPLLLTQLWTLLWQAPEKIRCVQSVRDSFSEKVKAELNYKFWLVISWGKQKELNGEKPANTFS